MCVAWPRLGGGHTGLGPHCWGRGMKGKVEEKEVVKEGEVEKEVEVEVEKEVGGEEGVAEDVGKR